MHAAPEKSGKSKGPYRTAAAAEEPGVQAGTSTGWTPGKNDIDWQGSGKGVKEALGEAFSRTGVPREDFEVTKWAKDKHGKSFPVEWRSKSGAEVSVDTGHKQHGPPMPHVGYQSPGKRGAGGGVRGHILLDSVPYNR